MHEVSTGGLSSYSLINMTIAHLQAEGFRMSDDGQPAQHGVSDLGNLLWGFLMRFGDVFDYNDQAISINEVRNPAICQSIIKAHESCWMENIVDLERPWLLYSGYFFCMVEQQGSLPTTRFVSVQVKTI